MTVAHTTVLSLLGKEVSFQINLDVPKKYINVFPSVKNIEGKVEAVLLCLSGHHQILIGDEFYQLSEIDLPI